MPNGTEAGTTDLLDNFDRLLERAIANRGGTLPAEGDIEAAEELLWTFVTRGGNEAISTLIRIVAHVLIGDYKTRALRAALRDELGG